MKKNFYFSKELQSVNGIDVLNDVEKINANQKNENTIISTRSKLYKLLAVFPKDSFYRSIQSQISRNKRLSKQQVKIIDKQYNCCFKK